MTLFTLDRKLLELAPQIYWTARHSVEGVQIFGGIGSGKTSGSGQTLALTYLGAGYGGLVLTAKPDEKTLWQEYCRNANREDDLIIVSPDGQHRFNFLEYESREGITDNLMQVLKTVIRAGDEKSSGGADNQFWQDSLDMLILYVIDLCRLAYDKVEMQTMFNIVQSLPKADTQYGSDDNNQYQEAFDLARGNIIRQMDEWKQTLSIDTLNRISRSQTALDNEACRNLPDVRTFSFIKQFFTETYRGLSDKTRSIIDFSFSAFMSRLLRDPVYSLFCDGESTFSPLDSIEGKIILIDLPVKQFHKVGQDAQIMFKYIWQRAMEKRKIEHDTLPVFLWADEAQHFLHEYDAEYQATARSSRIATVYISQNLPNYYANMGGSKSDFRVKSFLGTLGTKIFHANADIETNRYASELIGDVAFVETSRSVSQSKESQIGQNRSIKFDRLMRPETFSLLKSGGAHHGFDVEGILHMQSHEPNCFRQIFNQIQ